MALPAWAWAMACAAAVGIAWMTYRRMAVAPSRARALAALRAALLVLLAALACGPVLEVPRERIEPDAVLVLVDRSRSLEVEDMDIARARIEELGGRLVEVIHARPGESHYRMADPEGNEFTVVLPLPEDVARKAYGPSGRPAGA